MKYILYKTNDETFIDLVVDEDLVSTIGISRTIGTEFIDVEPGNKYKVFDTKEDLEESDLYSVRLISELKNEKHIERKTIRDSTKYAPTINTLNSTYKSDPETMTALGIARGELNGPYTTIEWWDTSDNEVVFTLANIMEFIHDVRLRGTIATRKSKTIKAEINAITNLTELQAYNVQERWDQL